MQKTVSNLDIQNNKKPIEITAAMLLLAAMMLAVFINSGLSVICGPIMMVLFAYLFFSGYHAFVTAAIITSNDALGTVIMGRLSFVYFLLLLVIVKMLCGVKFTTKRLTFFLIAMIFLVQLFVVDFVGTKMFFYSFIYIASLITIGFDGDEDATRQFFSGVAFAVVIIAVHAMLTGGVEFYELSSELKKQDDFVRKGILGVGIGNSNYSGILLNIGTIGLWHFTDLKKWIKFLCMVPILYAMVLTNSISGLIGFFVIVLVSVLLEKKKLKSICVLAIVIVSVVVAYNVYVDLPVENRNVELDHYIDRIEEKVEQMAVGDYGGATTHRSDLATDYLKYIFNEQSFFGMMFGGNPLIVESVADVGTHNTFLNLLLQCGFVGTFLICMIAVVKFIACFKNNQNSCFKGKVVLKIFCVVAGLGASLYANNLWAFWMLALVLL